MKKIETYKEPRWVKLRKTALARDKYTDQYWIRYGKMRNAEIVHHAFPVEDFPQYQYCLWNLVSVSRATHMMLHDRVNDELTDKGLEIMIRTARKNNIDVPYAYVKEIEMHREENEKRRLESKYRKSV